LGLDVGDKRIGVALSDPEGILASPFTIITRQDEPRDIEAVNTIINQRDVKRVIVGLPRSMDGSLGKQAEKVKDFAEKLTACIHVPVEFRDERLTTIFAKRLIREATPKKTKRQAHDDAVAAALILQSYLDEER